MSKNLFKRHRFPTDVILRAVRWYCRYPLSYRDVADLLAEHDVHVSPSTINRWVVKFGPEIARRVRKLHYPRTMSWHVDETYIRVAGKWKYLWRIIDQKGRFVNFRVTAKRDANAANAFLQQAQRDCGLYPPATIITDKSPTYPALIEAMHLHPYYNCPVNHIVSKWANNRIESDHASLKRLLNPGKGFQTLRSAKATLLATEAFRTIKRGDLYEPTNTVAHENQLLNRIFGFAR